MHKAAKASQKNTHKSNWIRSLLAEGLDYEIAVLETAEAEEMLPQLERWWIAYGRASGWPLTNLTDGGDGWLGGNHSEEAKAKIAAAQRGKVYSDSTKAKLAAALLGKSRPPEVRAKLKKAATGKTHSVETRAKMSATRKGRRHSAEHSKKIRDGLSRSWAARRAAKEIF